jgi:hypothetical protein
MNINQENMNYSHAAKWTWPVPSSVSRVLPQLGEPGSFWEDRGDRFHCGVDIYAPFKSDIVAVDDGIVLRTELFTSPSQIDYWNVTYAVTIAHNCGLVIRYAEMIGALLSEGTPVRREEVIGHVGRVLEPSRISQKAPLYIQKLKFRHPSMLHFEVLCRFPFEIPRYLGGNTFQRFKPEFLLDPAECWQKFSE